MAIEYAPRTFEPEKAIAAIAYLAERAQTTLYPIMKLFYIADRRHLERYGRFIAGDSYVAMSEGPVPKGAYNLVKAARGENIPVPGCELARETLACSDNHALEICGNVDYDELSRSDVECLDFALNELKTRGNNAIVKDAHDDAWKAVWKNRTTKAPEMSAVVIAGTLRDPEVLLAHLKDPNPGKAS